MTGFCIDTLSIDPALRPENGVLRVAALAVTNDAREAAQRILDDARAQADALVQQAQQEAQERLRATEEDTLQRAAYLIRTLEDANAALLERVQPVALELAQALFSRIAMDATPRERIEASLRRVQSEAPGKLVNPQLRVHPDDAGLLPELDWEVVPDASLVPGTCLLQADSGEWRADFNAAVAALNAAFAQAPTTSATEATQEDDTGYAQDEDETQTWQDTQE